MEDECGTAKEVMHRFAERSGAFAMNNPHMEQSRVLAGFQIDGN